MAQTHFFFVKFFEREASRVSERNEINCVDVCNVLCIVQLTMLLSFVATASDHHYYSVRNYTLT